MKRYILPLIVLILFSVLVFLVAKSTIFKPARAGLKIESTPQATVFLDGKEVGKTPFEDKELVVGEKILKLVPEDPNLFSWETKINLTGGALSFVERKFGENEALSSFEIITLEKLESSKKTAFSITSNPSSCLVKVDGQEKGFTPLSLEDLTEGSHTVVLSSPSFEEARASIQAVPGFRTILNFKLAQEEETEEKIEEEEKEDEEKDKIGEAEKAEEEIARPYVEIKETPTGWLRVRMGPSITATDSGNKVNPGDKFPLLDEESGWYKIVYGEDDEEGWISGQYAEKFE